jgi:hypothetical protein
VLLRRNIRLYPRRTKKAVHKFLNGLALGRREKRLVWRAVATLQPPQRPPKRLWGPGPWQDEPDFLTFTHANLHGVVWRNMRVSGALNGYVGVPPSHPWWGKHYAECVATPQCEPPPEPDYSSLPTDPAERGLWTAMKRFSESSLVKRLPPHWDCAHTPERQLEAHGGITYSGPGWWKQLPGDLWWFGFDTGHAWDISPMMDATLKHIYFAQDPSGFEWAERQRLLGGIGAVYRNLAYVRHEVEELAEQLALVAGVNFPP